MVKIEAIDLEAIKKRFEKAWSRRTAYKQSSRWLPEHPSIDQCAVTALVVQTEFGGEILRCPTKEGDSHYWNRLPDGSEIDLTEDQFDVIDDIPLKLGAKVRTRDSLLKTRSTRERYNLLSFEYIRAKWEEENATS